MSKRTPRLLLEDIHESAEKILEYTKNMSFEEFSKDNKTVDAVIGLFTIILVLICKLYGKSHLSKSRI